MPLDRYGRAISTTAGRLRCPRVAADSACSSARVKTATSRPSTSSPYFQTEHVVAFLRDLHYHFRGRIIVVWDGWKVHQAAAKLVQSKRLETVTCPVTPPS